MKIVVTGGAGFIGSHLCKRLLQEDHEVLCVDNFLTGHADNIAPLLSHKNFRLIEHDASQPLKIEGAINAIFHLASPASPNHHSRISYHMLPMETMVINTFGTLELLKMAKKHGAKFLFASTSEVYGDPLEHPQREEYNGNVSPVGPRAVYDEAKRFGETITSHFWSREGVDARIARIFNTYGPNMQPRDKRMIITFITEALANKPLTIFGDGSQTRALCFIDDMIEGLVRLMFYPQTRQAVVNLGSPHEKKVIEFAEIIKKITGSSSKIVFSEPLPLGDPKKRKPDITRAKKLLKWEPKVSLEEGLEKTINYFKKGVVK